MTDTPQDEVNPEQEAKPEEAVEKIDLSQTPEAEPVAESLASDPAVGEPAADATATSAPGTLDADGTGDVEVTAESTADASASDSATEPAAETETPAQSEDEASVPQLTLGGDVDSESGAAEDDDQPVFEPTIRGRVDKDGTAIGTGRRKTSVARVRIKEGNGEFVVNGRSFEDFFRIERDRNFVEAPLKATGEFGKVNVWVRVNGGGITGQTGAVVLGIARALQARNPECHPILAEGGYLTRDGRMVERKKYGKAKARKSFQFSKR